MLRRHPTAVSTAGGTLVAVALVIGIFPGAGHAFFRGWLAKLATAKRPLFMTFAFGMDSRFRRVYEQDDGILRVALMEKEGNGPALKEGKAFIRRLRRRANVLVAVGKHDRANALDRWQKERADGIGVNVDWVHTKFMLVDPLSDDPVVVTGSVTTEPPLRVTASSASASPSPER